MAAVENAEVLAIDALENSVPAVWSVLTTRTATVDVAAFQVARRAVRRAVKRRWPAAEAAMLVEFTTGYGTHSGGERRAHWNDMWKGIPATDVDELHDVASGAWCQGDDHVRGRQRVDAEPQAQYTGTVAEVGGLMRYLALHFQKADQAPPQGWRGHRFRTTRGYLAQPMAEMREQARASLRYRRELWKALKAGLEGEAAEEAAQRAVYEASELAWELVRLVRVPTAWGEDDLPSAWVELPVPVI